MHILSKLFGYFTKKLYLCVAFYVPMRTYIRVRVVFSTKLIQKKHEDITQVLFCSFIDYGSERPSEHQC